ncbi:uncharacterized protein ARMOST_18513 [Armillaria ostoyae]|uniref:Uncharacterized protein n=1 Tax=Armillaria ostoyae TaxID=47428 RepID=A0A284S1Y5_ARMOS|nr:uncharacterized protein ARMOST_18513 [Armillaria ostoyae]
MTRAVFSKTYGDAVAFREGSSREKGDMAGLCIKRRVDRDRVALDLSRGIAMRSNTVQAIPSMFQPPRIEHRMTVPMSTKTPMAPTIQTMNAPFTGQLHYRAYVLPRSTLVQSQNLSSSRLAPPLATVPSFCAAWTLTPAVSPALKTAIFLY